MVIKIRIQAPKCGFLQIFGKNNVFMVVFEGHTMWRRTSGVSRGLQINLNQLAHRANRRSLPSWMRNLPTARTGEECEGGYDLFLSSDEGRRRSIPPQEQLHYLLGQRGCPQVVQVPRRTRIRTPAGPHRQITTRPSIRDVMEYWVKHRE